MQSVEARIRKAELENVYSMRQRIIEGTRTEPGVPLFWLHAMLNSETLKNIIQVRCVRFYWKEASSSNFAKCVLIWVKAIGGHQIMQKFFKKKSMMKFNPPSPGPRQTGAKPLGRHPNSCTVIHIVFNFFDARFLPRVPLRWERVLLQPDAHQGLWCAVRAGRRRPVRIRRTRNRRVSRLQNFVEKGQKCYPPGRWEILRVLILPRLYRSIQLILQY